MTCVCGKDSWFVDVDSDEIRCEWCSTPLPEKIVRRQVFDRQVYVFTAHNMFLGRKVEKLTLDCTPVEWPDDLGDLL